MPYPLQTSSDLDDQKTTTAPGEDGGESHIRRASDAAVDIVEVSTRHLSALDVPLAIRILRIEAGFEARGGAPIPLFAARVLRVALRRATQFVPPASDGPASFDQALGESLRSTYAWTFQALDGLLSERAPPDATQVESSLVDMIEACEIRASFDPHTATLRAALVSLLHAARALVRTDHAAALAP